ncbi:sigma-70 family RNA polymerase sigma factor [Clostridium botulinum]|uniref:sigma factor-like helix-turn-helix DNA-binding protein n=1 Tax=Clostridium botulinum TaxID=1491 RepID=UPI0005862E47|nr:sigma-70, region 4 family protein [Clostridium botulinum CDC_297]APR00446.1 sigma-70, region 4 family protein [Clostridium botulinum]AUN04796.1 hypothetical protein RSJ19_18600 [Clostridium botulinum]MBN3396853.1 hypothetical protein [Clostridium botulinum]MBN3412362.1 hypothetical protein [Clostridium botulinum]
MNPSSFQTTIENQFDYICKRAMDDERKDYIKILSRQSKREIFFSDMGDYLVNQFSVVDSYSTDHQIFTWNGFTVGVENDLLSEALRSLPDKKREIILLYYFMDINDTEIAELLKLNRFTVYRYRISGMKTTYPMIPSSDIVAACRYAPRFPNREVCLSIKAYCHTVYFDRLTSRYSLKIE